MATEYDDTPFHCGACERPLDFMSRSGLFPGAWYVHRDDHRYHCGSHWGSDTGTYPLLFWIGGQRIGGRMSDG